MVYRAGYRYTGYRGRNNRNARWFLCVRRRGKTKPVISGPLPADPDRLEGDKWRYVILTRLDTDPPPERPPRTRRRRLQQRRLAGTADGGGRRGSARRPRPVRRHPVTVAAGRGQLTDATARRSRRRRRPATAVAAMGPGLIVRRDGFFAAVDRCFSMADGLSS